MKAFRASVLRFVHDQAEFEPDGLLVVDAHGRVANAGSYAALREKQNLLC